MLSYLSIKVAVPALFCLAFSVLPVHAEIETTWHTKPIAYKTLGPDVNNFYRMVGLPKNCICQFMSSQPAYSEGGHDFFGVSGHPHIFMEVEFSAKALVVFVLLRNRRMV